MTRYRLVCRDGEHVGIPDPDGEWIIMGRGRYAVFVWKGKP